jgi:hypothetical protein
MNPVRWEKKFKVSVHGLTMKNTLPALVLHIHVVGKALRSACVSAAAVPARRGGNRGNSFHAPKVMRGAGIVANASSI